MSFDKKVIKEELERIAERQGASKDEVFSTFKALASKTDDIEGVLIATESKFRTPAQAFMGLIFYVGEKVDLFSWHRREALRRYKENPQLAIAEGYVNNEGVPLDRRETIIRDGKAVANPSFGKPLKPVYKRRIIGMLAPVNEGEIPDYRFAVMNMVGKLADVYPKRLGEGLLTYGILKNDNGYKYVINGSRRTVFKDVTLDIIEEAKSKGWDPVVAAIKTLISPKFYPEAFISPDDIVDHVINTTINDWDFVAVTEGRIISAYSYETPFGMQYRLVLKESRASDVEVELRLNERDFQHTVSNVGAGSKVFVIGKPGVKNYYDREKGVEDPEVKVPVWFSEGIFVESLIPVEEAPLSRVFDDQSVDELEIDLEAL